LLKHKISYIINPVLLLPDAIETEPKSTLPWNRLARSLDRRL